MNYYKVMLVDDEETVREAIARKLAWEEIGFQVVALAENGEDALEKAEQYAPDVVMSDICMPFMDGLTFCKKLKELMPGTKIIFFSGYDEFEYAKEAIRLEAEEYILKPIDAQELQEIFIRIKKNLDEELDRRRNVDRLKRYYEESIPMLQDQLIIGLLEGRIASAGWRERSVAEYGLKLEAAFYMVGVIQSDEEEGSNLRAVSIKQLVDEQLDGKIEFKSVNYLGTIVVIALLHDTASSVRFIALMNQNCKLAGRMLGSAVTAGIGKVYGSKEHISHSYLEAREAVAYRIMMEPGQAIYIGDVEPETMVQPVNGEEWIRGLVREIKVGTPQSLDESVVALIEKLKKSTITTGWLQLFFTEIMIELIRLARSYQLKDGEWDKLLERDFSEEMKRFRSLDELGEWLVSICHKLRNAIRKERTDTTRLLTDKALAFVAEHYMESELSIDKVCSHLGVSATYFYSLFKKEMGMSFVAYLTRVRMEQAIRLLDTTDEKSYVIAGMVGYEEPNYFSYVFKKQYGISPSRYRQSKGNGEDGQKQNEK